MGEVGEVEDAVRHREADAGETDDQSDRQSIEYVRRELRDRQRPRHEVGKQIEEEEAEKRPQEGCEWLSYHELAPLPERP